MKISPISTFVINILLGFNVTVAAAGNSGPSAGNARLGEILGVFDEMFEQYEYNEATALARKLYSEAEQGGDEELKMYSAVYLGQAYAVLNERDSMEIFLGQALAYGEKFDNRLIVARVHNAYGLYSVNVEKDYVQGLKHYHKALDEARVGSPDYFYPVVLGNISIAYYYRRDPAGLDYAQEAYAIGKKNDAPYIIFAGSMTSAFLYYMLGDYMQAYEYVKEALPYMEQHSVGLTLYTLYADIAMAMDNTAEAKVYYDKALENIDRAQPTEALNTYLSVGRYYLAQGQPQKAEETLARALRLERDKNVPMYRYRIYEALSEIYSATGRYEKALEYFTMFHFESDSLFSIEREGTINELRIAYETEKKERVLLEKEAQIAREQKKSNAILLTSSFIIVIILAGTLAGYLVRRKTNRMYSRIVKQYYDYVKQGKSMSVPPPSIPAAADTAQTPAAPDVGPAEGPKEKKGEELFARLEEKMRSEHLYRGSDITVSRLAEILDTNRSYLSQAINDHTGGTFYNYIYSYRIEEAVSILTGEEGDMPLKAIADHIGFTSLNTFYVKFKEKMGMPPSKFRENWKKLSENDR